MKLFANVVVVIEGICYSSVCYFSFWISVGVIVTHIFDSILSTFRHI